MVIGGMVALMIHSWFRASRRPARPSTLKRGEWPLHERVERVFEAGDLRLVYGLGVPLLVVVAGVSALAVVHATWLVIPLMAMVVALTGIVLVGVARMLDEGGDGDQ